MTARIPPTEYQEAQYKAWRQHPMTRFMFQYYGDYARALEDDAVTRWKTGEFDPKIEHEARGRVATLDEIPALEWKSVMAFYNVEVKEPEEESEHGKQTTE